MNAIHKLYWKLPVMLCLLCASWQATAQEALQDSSKESRVEEKLRELSFSYFGYTWLVGSKGQIVNTEGTFTVKEDFTEVYRNPGSARAGGSLLTGAKRYWGGFTDNVFLDVGLGPQVSGGDTLLLSQRIFYSLTGPYYRAVAWKDLEGLTSLNYRLTFFPLIAARLTHMVYYVEAQVKGYRTWVEPVIGSMATFRLDKTGRVTLFMMGNVGGFGAGSTFAWESWAILGMDLSKNISAHVGYRAIGQNYDAPDAAFGYHATVHGVWALIEFRFLY